MKQDFSAQLTRIRTMRGYTQQALAYRLGFAPSYICHLERGRRLPSVQNLGKLADALDVSTDFLLGRTQETLPQYVYATRATRLIEACEHLTTAQVSALVQMAQAMNSHTGDRDGR